MIAGARWTRDAWAVRLMWLGVGEGGRKGGQEDHPHDPNAGCSKCLCDFAMPWCSPHIV